ncbi:MAG: hypothetical protein HYZ53_28710 [Planctomycetes bacterium]|nr:hypothetical protein [Planctomycetota bacterium]
MKWPRLATALLLGLLALAPAAPAQDTPPAGAGTPPAGPAAPANPAAPQAPLTPDAPAAPATTDLPPEKQGPAVKEKESRVTYQTIQSWKQGETRVTVLLGNTELIQAGTYLRADSLVGWSQEKPPAPEPETDAAGEPPGAADKEEKILFDEVYAEGNVRLIRRGGEQIESDQVYLNFREHTGEAIHSLIRQTTEKKGTTVVIRAEKVRQIDRERFVADNAEISQCDFGDPHVSLQVKRIDFRRDEARGGKASFAHLIPQTSGFPLLYIPYYWFRIGQSYPLRAVSISQSSQFGHVVRTDWGLALKRKVLDENGKPVLDKDGTPKTKKWGDLLLNVDYLEKRGIGAGIDLDLEVDRTTGYLNSYYIHDDGPDASRSFDQQFLPQAQEDRGRLRLFSRTQVTDKLRFDAELSFLSDRFFLPEFFKREFQEGKEQETYGYLRYVDGNFGGTLDAKVKINEFLEEVEYLPRIGARWIGQPLVEEKLYYTTLNELAYVRFNPDIAGDARLFESVRFDTYHELSYPLSAGPVQVLPFVGGRVTAYDEDASGNGPLNRFLASAGVRCYLQANRVFDVESPGLGLHGLRHITSLDVRPTANFGSSERFQDLHNFDTVDAADDFAEVALEWRHRFQTQRLRRSADGKEAYQTLEFLSTGLEVEYYPDPGRDTSAVRPQNFLYPMNWITSTPEVGGGFDQNEWSNLHWDATFTPDLPYSASTEVEWNPQNGKVESWTSGVTANPAGWITVGVSNHYIRGLTSAVIASVSWQASDKWYVRAQESFDFEKNAFLKHSISFARDVHDFDAELFVHIDRGTDDLTAGFAITPRVNGKSRSKIINGVGYDRTP